MVTGRISLTEPLYSPISSSVREVRRISSSFHCRAADRVGDQDQRRRLGVGHRGRADQGLAGPAREHDDPGAAVPERLGRLLLVGPQGPLGLVELDLVGLAVDVPGEVLGRPADLEQRLLEVAALGRVDDDGVVVDAGADHAGDLLGAQHLLEHRPVVADQHEAVHGVLLQPQPAVARHRLGDVDEQRVGDGVPAELQQGVDDLLGVVPGGARVPQPQRRQPVGVDVLRRPLELGERRDRLAAVGGALVVDLEQQRLVALHDQGSVEACVGHNLAKPTDPLVGRPCRDHGTPRPWLDKLDRRRLGR